MEIKIVMVGTHKSGKYSLGNSLLQVQNDGSEDYLDREQHDLPTCQVIKKTVDQLQLFLVATPDIRDSSGELSVKAWNDLIIAQDHCGEHTDVFLLVLNFQEKDKSKQLVQNFKDVFGDASRSKCMVVYTNNLNPMNENYDRELECKFDFVDDILKKGYPIYKWDQIESDEVQAKQLREIIRKLASGSPYTREDFKSAQLELIQRWVAKSDKVPKKRMLGDEAAEFHNIPINLIKKLFAKDKGSYTKVVAIMNRE